MVVAVRWPYSSCHFFSLSFSLPSHNSAFKRTPDDEQHSVQSMNPRGVGFLGRKVMWALVAPAHWIMLSSTVTVLPGHHALYHFATHSSSHALTGSNPSYMYDKSTSPNSLCSASASYNSSISCRVGWSSSVSMLCASTASSAKSSSSIVSTAWVYDCWGGYCGVEEEGPCAGVASGAGWGPARSNNIQYYLAIYTKVAWFHYFFIYILSVQCCET